MSSSGHSFKLCIDFQWVAGKKKKKKKKRKKKRKKELWPGYFPFLKLKYLGEDVRLKMWKFTIRIDIT